jgi:hypothetical protein
MDSNLVIGIVALGYGLVTLVMRLVQPNSSHFGKFGPMKERWGETGGTIVHWVAYTIAPLVFGAGLVFISFIT